MIGADRSQLSHDLVELGERRAARTSRLPAVLAGATARGTSPGPGTALANAPGAAESRPERRRRRSGTITQP